jgi:uncharacterized membrane protein YadS
MIPFLLFFIIEVKTKEKNYSILNIFPYFVLGFVGMIILRNIGDQFFFILNNNWIETINIIKFFQNFFNNGYGCNWIIYKFKRY